MQTVFRVIYSLVVAVMFLLFVILGTQAFYAAPEEPEYPYDRFGPFAEPIRIDCDFEGECFDPQTGEDLTEEEERERRQEQAKQNEERRQAEEEYREAFERFVTEERAPYHRNVFIMANVLGVLAVAAGLVLFRRVEALPLGLLFGGLMVVIFGWVQAAEDFDEIGMTPLFLVVAVGLAIVLAGGYRFLGLVRPTEGAGE